MKKLIFTLSLLLTASIVLQAQFGACVPDPSFQDSVAGVYPLPYDATATPDGGIQDSACLNKDYQFVFTAVVGDTLTLGPTSLILDSIRINNVAGLPGGFSYNCSTPNCTFAQNTIGCAVIFGKATNPADLGPHDLTISATLFSSGLPITLAFPNPLIAPGKYTLYVLPEDNTNCSVYINSTFEVNSAFETMRNIPNPFSHQTTIEVQSRESGLYQFQVRDMLGRAVHTRPVQVFEGLNLIDFDGAGLPDGLYLYSFSNGASIASGKMVVRK